jgi:uncharacterized membrane-anchored protein YitT (DUF2179 family)
MLRLSLLTISNLIYAMSIYFLIQPNALADGGMMGVALLIHYATGSATALVYAILNVPIFIWSWFRLGFRVVLSSAYSIAIMTLTLYLLSQTFHPPQPSGMWSGSVLAGVCIGYSLGIVLRLGSATGGIDLLALVIHRVWRIRISHVMFGFDAVVVLLAGSVVSWTAVSFTLLFLLITNVLVDVLIHRWPNI